MNVSLHFAMQAVIGALVGIVLWVSCAGIGLAVLPADRATTDETGRASWRQMGLAACIGLATLFAIGGVGVLFSVPIWLYVVPFVVGGLVLVGRFLAGNETHLALSRPVLIVSVVAIVAVVAVAIVESMAGLRFPANPCDDLRAYIPMARRLLDTGGIDEPWSVRRAQSMGGFDLLRAFPVWAVGNGAADMADTTIASIFLAGLFVANGLRVKWIRVVGVLLVVTIPLFWVPRANSTGVLMATPFVVALLATTLQARAALRARRVYTAARWAVASGLVIAAVMSVRPDLAFFGALIVAVGAVSIGGVRFSDRVRAIAVAAVTSILAVAPWSIAMWRTIGTPIYPLFAGNVNTPALQAAAPVPDFSHRIHRVFELMRLGPYFWVTVGVIVAALLARKFLADPWLIVSAGIVSVIVSLWLAYSAPLIRWEPFARYVAPMSEGLAVFLLCEVLRSADVRTRAEAAGRAAWTGIAFASGAAIVLVAASFSAVNVTWRLPQSGARLVQRAFRGTAPGQAKIETADLRESYRQALAGTEGKRTIAAVDRPYLIDYEHFNIPNLDAPGFAAPDATFPFFTGPIPKIEKLRAAGYDLLLVTDPQTDLCLNVARVVPQTHSGPSAGIYQRFLDWDRNIQQIAAQAPDAVTRFGSLIRIDLAKAQTALTS